MPLYVRTLLITGPPGEAGPAAERHIAHLRELYRAGKLHLAGELGRGDGFLEILEVRDLLEAEEVARSSPLVELGLERSPEIAQLDLGIDAQEAYLGATKRAYYVPRVGASVSGTWNAWRSDGGQGGIDLSGLPTGVNATLPQMPSAYATAGVSASLPLFEGRSRIADQSEASWDLIRLESERLRFEQLWELRIRTAVLDLEAAYQRVKMSKISVRGALRNLDWAQDAYARGLASQIQLLDARSETLQANVGLTDARFGLLASLIEVKRSIASDLAQGSEANLQKQISILLSEEGP